ncbi:MAG: hypothetical protein OYI31_07125 [Chloroflexota bacterium]|nr:hypothetical protein [Chloroflexota bacterium]MDE2941033.1 hypothetical protein [Chloroflexota bacterium]MDE3268199.1 hypothetical protein [Chloroflexota bacterium]
MPYLLGLLLALAVAALIAWPLLRARRSSPLPRRGALDALKEVQHQRAQAYDDIRILGLDRELGHVTAERFAETYEAHRLRAALLLRQEEDLRAELSPRMNKIEDDVLAVRLASGSVLSTTECEDCGGLRDTDAPFCPRCETDSLGFAGETTEAE